MQKLKASYDAAQEEEDELLNAPEGKGDENPADDKPTEPLAIKGKSDDLKSSSCGQIAEVVKEVTENEQAEPPLHEKVSSLVDSLPASGLNEPAPLKLKENIKRPENCKRLHVTKLDSEIWDSAQKTTRSMDARLQKVQESLVKGVIPIVGLIYGNYGRSPSKGRDIAFSG